MSDAAPAGWVAVRTCLSPKQGGGWADLYWSAPYRRRTWGPLCEDTLVFDAMAELEAALVETWGGGLADVAPA